MNFDEVIAKARQALPLSIRHAPWIGLEHGVEPLKTELQLNQYLAAYGKMHTEKIKLALKAIDNPSLEFNRPINVVDWGCGQALASCAFFDWISGAGISLDNISHVTLVEPSQLALARATANVESYIGYGKTTSICKFLENTTEDDFVSDEESVTVHLFSNVLDIESIDLERLSDLIHSKFHNRQIFCCVSPQNQGSSRIEEFAERFGISHENIVRSMRGYLENTKGTVALLTFIVDDVAPRAIVSEIISEPKISVTDMVALQRVLRHSAPQQDVLSRIFQFYQMATELERIKEPSLQDAVSFPAKDIGGGILHVNCSGNDTFKENYRRNADRTRTKWPKDLHFGIDVALGEKAYRLLYFIKPLDELTDSDITSTGIDITFSSFSVSLGSAEALELSDDVIAEIDRELHSDTMTWKSLSELIEKLVGSGATLDTENVQVSFCDKNIALAQIFTELKDMRSPVAKEGSILEAFLKNASFNNKVGDIKPEELIQIVDMDSAQRTALTTALNNRVSVVVGPPGCGKTQLILNLLANSLIMGKKVLVASKNNKAVDNVKDRFSKFDEAGCFLRFGTKGYVKDVTLPHIEGLLTRVQNEKYDDSEFADVFANYNNRCADIRKAYKLIDERKRLESKCLSLTAARDAAQSHVDEARAAVENDKRVFLSGKESLLSLDSVSSADIKEMSECLRKSRNDVAYRSRGIRRLWADWFQVGEMANRVLNVVSGFPPEIVEYLRQCDDRSYIDDFSKCAEIIDFCAKYIKAFDEVLQFRKELAGNNDVWTGRVNKTVEELESCSRDLGEVSTQLLNINEWNPEDVLSVKCRDNSNLELGQKLTSLSLSHYLHMGDSARGISGYKLYLPDSIPWRQDEISAFEAATRRFLDVFRLVAVTSLSIKGAFPKTSDLFDLLIIDEASQCDVASALPLILRAKQIVIIGDPKQLQHISRVSPEEEIAIKRHLNLTGAVHLKYCEASLWDYTRNFLIEGDVNTEPCVLENHYRCHPDIIGYSNEMFYRDFAIGGLKVCTAPSEVFARDGGVKWIDVQGKQQSDTCNVNKAEVLVVTELISKYSLKFKTATIGIVTPFAAQAERLNQIIPDNLRDRVTANTAHKFQGDEKDIMIYSLVVTDNSPDSKIRWIDYKVPNLVNVAVTRAKSLLIIVGNREYIRGKSPKNCPLGHLVDYVGKLEKRDSQSAISKS